MNLNARQLRSGRWAIYNGRTRYITTSYATKAQAQARIRVELQWGSRGSTQIHLPRRTA